MRWVPEDSSSYLNRHPAGSSRILWTRNTRFTEGAKPWADDPDFPLDDTTVTAMVDLLTSLKPQQTITDGDTLEAYGLDDPFATLTATTPETS